MGCCAANELEPVQTNNKDEDLAEPSLSGITDSYLIFELKLPFARTLINTFIAKVNDAETACGEQGYVTIESLAVEFSSPAWKDLKDPDSVLVKLLTSAAFKDEKKGHGADQIDADFLRCFGLLNCAGKNEDKARWFYGVLQEGGLDAHQFISATDKDLNPIFEKMCGLASWELFTIADQTGSVDSIYDDSQCNLLQEKVEDLREDHLLEDIFGVNSRMENADWLESVAKKANWVFSTT